MSDAIPTSVAVEATDDKVPKIDDSLITKDEKSASFINEALWRKVLFKILAYVVYVFGLAIVTNGFVEFDFVKFVTGIQVIVLPIIWSALDIQARNKEIQDKIVADEKAAAERAAWDKQSAADAAEIEKMKAAAAEKQLEIYRLKAVLLSKTENVEALNAAVAKADAMLKTADSLG